MPFKEQSHAFAQLRHGCTLNSKLGHFARTEPVLLCCQISFCCMLPALEC